MIILYGATGFTGNLILDEALAAGLRPVLAGRGASTTALAERHGLSARLGSLGDGPALAAMLEGANVLLNCAGPFSVTAPPLIRACLSAGVHYLDLAGEVDEHCLAMTLTGDAFSVRSAVIPGVGFGVAATEIAAHLALAALPDATGLVVAYDTRGTPSRGTLETVLPMLHIKGIKIADGVAITAKPSERSEKFVDGERSVRCVTNPWRADLVSLVHSTSVANIETLANFPSAAHLLMKIGGWPLGRFLVKQVFKGASVGPTPAQRATGATTVWARAITRDRRVLVTMHGPDPYDFTARAAVACACMAMKAVSLPGFQTPASAFGTDWLQDLQGVSVALMP